MGGAGSGQPPPRPYEWLGGEWRLRYPQMPAFDPDRVVQPFSRRGEATDGFGADISNFQQQREAEQPPLERLEQGKLPWRIHRDESANFYPQPLEPTEPTRLAPSLTANAGVPDGPEPPRVAGTTPVSPPASTRHCPRCGNGGLERREGCWSCLTCGYSHCG